MKNNVLEITSVVVLALFCINPTESAADTTGDLIFQASPLGKCYDSLEIYMTSSFGIDYRGDENLVVSLPVFGYSKKNENHVFKWMTDMTPTRNPTRLLFRIDANGQACIILFAPLAKTISYPANSKQLPKNFTTRNAPSAAEPTTTIVYKSDRNSLFRPIRCTRISNRGRPNEFDCLTYRLQ